MTNELFSEKYKPKDIKSYIGFDHPATIHYIERVLDGTEKKKGFIMWGEPGTGKSVLANLLSEHFNISQHYTNASDERKKSQINVDIFRTKSLEDNKTLIIYDECDGLSKSAFRELEKVMKKYSQPVILIANDLTKIPYSLRSICHVEKFSVNRFTLLVLANRVMKTENLKLSKSEIKSIVDQSKSFRALLYNIEFGMSDHPPERLDVDTIALKCLHGESVDLPTNDLNGLIVRFNDNSSNPALISLANLWESRYRNGYTPGKYIVTAILSTIRDPQIKKINYPRTYRLLHESKTGKKRVDHNNEKKSSAPKIKILGFR